MKAEGVAVSWASARPENRQNAHTVVFAWVRSHPEPANRMLPDGAPLRAANLRRLPFHASPSEVVLSAGKVMGQMGSRVIRWGAMSLRLASHGFEAMGMFRRDCFRRVFHSEPQ